MFEKIESSNENTGYDKDRMMLLCVKLLLQLCLTVVSVVSWLIPMRMPRFTENTVAVSIANAFSGGIFLSLAFGHLLPDSVEAFHSSDFSHTLPYFLSLFGYMLIFFIEKIAFNAHYLIEHNHHHEHIPTEIHGSSAPFNGKEQKGEAAPIPSARSALILLLALSVHSVFETMAVGLCGTALEASLLAFSILLHTPAESVALLVSFLKSGLPQSQVALLLTIFSLVGPFGLGTGIVVSRFAGKIVDAVLIALTSGTFIYVGATEIIAEEFEVPEHKWKKFAALTAGILLIALITSYAENLAPHTHTSQRQSRQHHDCRQLFLRF